MAEVEQARRSVMTAPGAPIKTTLAGVLTRLFTLRFTGQVTLHFLGGKVQFAEWGKPERYLISDAGPGVDTDIDDDRS